MAEAVGADLREAGEVRARDVASYDLVGLGSGIYFSRHHRDLLALVAQLEDLKGKPFFLFSTSGFEELVFHEALKERVTERGGRIVGEFKCGGWHTFGPFMMDGGLQQGRPDEVDLRNAALFARQMVEAVRSGL